jgi:alkylation response protein AidB-like acyl-CoA dehydrogenase
VTVSEHYLTEERLMIQEAARAFVRREVIPVANELDPVQGPMPAELIRQMGELGYFGIRMAPEFGGLGLGVFEYCLIAEELSRGWMSVGSIIARAGSLMDVGGWSLERRQEKTAAAARGDYLSAIALSEPDVGSDLAGVSCRARRVGDHYEIRGSKYWCTFADGADYISLLARLDGDDGQPVPGRAGLITLIIEKERGTLPAGCQGAPIPKIGYFGWKTWELTFDGTQVPAENQVTGSGGAGFQHAVDFLNVGRVHTAARSIGLARGALEDAMAYAGERVQFGQPISEFQETRFKLARMASDIEASRQLMYHTCALMDAGATADREAAMAKWHASEMAERVTSDALQIFGGAGYTTLHAVERYWRDARLTKIFEGTSEIQLRIISDRLLGKPSRR